MAPAEPWDARRARKFPKKSPSAAQNLSSDRATYREDFVSIVALRSPDARIPAESEGRGSHTPAAIGADPADERNPPSIAEEPL